MSFTMLSPNYLQQGSDAYQAKLDSEPDYVAISDPVFTPYHLAMQLAGYEPVLHESSRSLVLQCCKNNHCKNSSAVLYDSGNCEVLSCSDCGRIYHLN